MALVKKIILFIITLFFIVILLIGATNSYAVPFSQGASRCTLDCEQFIESANQIDEDGELSGCSFICSLGIIFQ